MNFNEMLLDGAEDGKIELVEYAIENGADVNTKNVYGWTALHRASIKRHPEIVKTLISHGVDVHAKDSYGQTARYWALCYGYSEIAKLIETYTEY